MPLYKLDACSKCRTVKAIDLTSVGDSIYCPVCKKTVPAIHLDIESIEGYTH